MVTLVSARVDELFFAFDVLPLLSDLLGVGGDKKKIFKNNTIQVKSDTFYFQ